jgi:hypothetical protein
MYPINLCYHLLYRGRGYSDCNAMVCVFDRGATSMDMTMINNLWMCYIDIFALETHYGHYRVINVCLFTFISPGNASYYISVSQNDIGKCPHKVTNMSVIHL